MNPEERNSAVAVQIYIVEDHEIVREMLCLYAEQEDDMEVCGVSETAEDALERLGGHSVDLVLVDVALPGMSGIELVEAVRQRWPELVCLMYSGHGEAGYVERSLEAGARGYVLKGEPDELSFAIRQVMAGEQYVSPALSL